MAQTDTQAKRTYRAAYHPKDQNGHPVASETGVLRSIEVQAVNAEAALLQAGALTGCVIAGVERLDADEPAEVL